MKRLLLIVLPLLLIVGCEKNGLHTDYYKNADGSNGQKFREGKKQGIKKVGKWTEWYKNGQIKVEETFTDGERDGLVTWWYENGQKDRELNYKIVVDEWGIGKEVFDGLHTYYNEKGQKKSESTYEDGKRISKTDWYKNGEKEKEQTYKDEELVSSKCWDEDGKECECSANSWEGCK